MRVSLQTMYLDERVHGSGVTRALAALTPPPPPVLAVRAQLGSCTVSGRLASYGHLASLGAWR